MEELKEKEIADNREMAEKKLAIEREALQKKEEHHRRMEDKQMVFVYHQAKEKNKKNNKKPTALGELRKIYPKWCEENPKFDPEVPPQKNKQYYRTDILRTWQESKEYGYWLENHDEHDWKDPSDSEVTKIYSSTHTKLHVHIHPGNLPSEKRMH